MSNNPYAAPSAAVSEYVSIDDKDRIRRIARGQRMMVWAVLGQWFASAVSVASDSVALKGVMSLAAIACMVMAIVGAVRLSRALGSHVVTTVLVAILMIVPLINLVTMLVLSMRATRALRKAGVRVGLMGAKVD